MIDVIRNPIRRASRRWFFASMSAAIAITVFFGFAPTFYLRTYFHPEPLPWLLVLHGRLQFMDNSVACPNDTHRGEQDSTSQAPGYRRCRPRYACNPGWDKHRDSQDERRCRHGLTCFLNDPTGRHVCVRRFGWLRFCVSSSCGGPQ